MGVLMIIATGSLQLISYAIKKSNVGLSLVTEQELRLAIGDALYNTNKNPNKCKNNLVLKSGDESKVEKIQALPDSIDSGQLWNKTSKDLSIKDITLDIPYTCMDTNGSTEHTACTSKEVCEKKHKSAKDCTEDATNGTAGTWEQNTTSRRRTLTVYFTRAKAGGFKTKLNKVCDPQDNKLGGCYSVQCGLRDYKLASGATKPTSCNLGSCTSLNHDPALNYLSKVGSCKGRFKCMGPGCKVGEDIHTACTTKEACEKKHSATDCTEDATGGSAGTWESVEHTACYDESKTDNGKSDCEKKHKSNTDCTEDCN